MNMFPCGQSNTMYQNTVYQNTVYQNELYAAQVVILRSF
jgi:hypothetical protein